MKIENALFPIIPLLLSCCTPSAPSITEDQQKAFTANLQAHHLCAGIFVVGREYQRSPEDVLAQDVAPFEAFQWDREFSFEVDDNSRTVVGDIIDSIDRSNKP